MKQVQAIRRELRMRTMFNLLGPLCNPATPRCVVVGVGDAGLFRPMAEALAALGADGVAANRLTLITGPSRTADIEKRIVLGVHGPKSLHVIVVWPQND